MEKVLISLIHAPTPASRNLGDPKNCLREVKKKPEFSPLFLLSFQEENSCPGLRLLTPGAAADKAGESTWFINVLLNLLSLQHLAPPETLAKVFLGLGSFGK